MLSMKTLRVAIVTMGSALLLGPGLAAAVAIQLDGTMTAAPSPLLYATETLPVASAMGRYAITFPDSDLDLHVKPRRRIDAEEDVYLRLDLTGAVIGDTAPQMVVGVADEQTRVIAVGTATPATISSGGSGSDFIVIEIGVLVDLGNTVGVQLADAELLATSGTVSATIRSYTSPDDALDEVGATGAFRGTTTIVNLVSGVNTIIKAAPTAAVASVNTGFVRFTGAFSANEGGAATLGWLGVEERIRAENAPASVPTVYNESGAELMENNIISDTGTISFNVAGNLDIGAFTTTEESGMFVRETLAMSIGCNAPNAAGAPDRGTFVDDLGMMLVGEEGELPSGVDSASTGGLTQGLYVVCVNVDVAGPTTNMTAIPAGTYTATAHIKRNNGANTPLQMVGEEGTFGAIRRNGASVEIPYLTTSAKHNQRLIVVNRGTRDVPVTSIEFTSEADTDAELMSTVQAALDAGLVVVPAGETMVIRMDETISITGGSARTAATIAFFGTAGKLSVATTQINLSDGSTDTVVYNVDGD